MFLLGTEAVAEIPLHFCSFCFPLRFSSRTRHQQGGGGPPPTNAAGMPRNREYEHVSSRWAEPRRPYLAPKSVPPQQVRYREL
eukprot:SAG25_NODE_272_length_10613_cov_6.416191_17_plen_83_part_00